MKSISDLTDFYYNDLHPDLQELEKKREAIKAKLIKVFVALAVFTGGVLFWIYSAVGYFHDSMFFVAILALIIGTMLYRFMIKDYVGDFKLQIIKPLIHAIDEHLRYTPKGSISEKLFVRSKLFKHRIDRYRGNDHVKGKIDHIPLQFSDVHAEYKTRDSKGRTRWHTIFQGLFIVAEFNKSFKGETIIVPDNAEKLLGSVIGNWLQSKNMNRNELVKMDNPEFEKAFVVYGTDQIEARYILTHAMMDRLLGFKKRTGENLFISFTGDHIHLAINYKKDLFEPTVFTSLLNYKQAMEYIQTLKLAIGIVEELKLNQRLWSKV